MKLKRILKINGYFDIIDERVLIFLYQPIVGINAIAFYKYLIQESKIIKTIGIDFSFDRAMKFLCIDEKTIEECINKLEALELLRESINHNKDTIIYQIMHPMSAFDFLHRKNFNNILKEKLSESEIEFINVTFGNDFDISFDTNNFVDNSSSFPDVFPNVSFDGVKNGNCTIDFSISYGVNNPLLKDFKINEIIEHFKNIGITISETDERTIKIISSVYSFLKISNKDLVFLISDAYIRSENEFDLVKVRNIVDSYYRKNNNAKKQTVSEIIKNKKIESFKNYAPEFFVLKLTQQSNLNKNTELLINELRSYYLFDDASINCLMEYSCVKNGNLIIKNYIDKIAKFLIRKKLVNFNEIFNHFYKNIKNFKLLENYNE